MECFVIWTSTYHVHQKLVSRMADGNWPSLALRTLEKRLKTLLRFFKSSMTPSFTDTIQTVATATGCPLAAVAPVGSPSQVLALTQGVRHVQVSSLRKLDEFKFYSLSDAYMQHHPVFSHTHLGWSRSCFWRPTTMTPKAKEDGEFDRKGPDKPSRSAGPRVRLGFSSVVQTNEILIYDHHF